MAASKVMLGHACPSIEFVNPDQAVDLMTEKPEGNPARTIVSLNALLGVSIALMGVSFLSAVAFLAGAPFDRAALFSLGFTASIIGTGVSLWCALRLKQAALLVVAICSLVPFAFWAGLFFLVLTDRIVIG
jgi:hypothetical protein